MYKQCLHSHPIPWKWKPHSYVWATQIVNDSHSQVYKLTQSH